MAYTSAPVEYMNTRQAQAQLQQQTGAAYPADQQVLPLDHYDDNLGPPMARLEQSLKWKYGERKEPLQTKGSNAANQKQPAPQTAPQPPATYATTLREQSKPQLPSREPPPVKEEPPPPPPPPLPAKEPYKPQKALPQLPKQPPPEDDGYEVARKSSSKKTANAPVAEENDGYEEVDVRKSTTQKAAKPSRRPHEHEAYAVTPNGSSKEPTYMEGRYAVAGYKLAALAASTGSHLSETDLSKRSSAAAAYSPETSNGLSSPKKVETEEMPTYRTIVSTQSSSQPRLRESETAIDGPPVGPLCKKRGVVVEYEGSRREDEVEVVRVGDSGPSIGYWSGEVNGGVAYSGDRGGARGPGVGYWSGEVNGGVGYTNTAFSRSEEALTSYQSASFQVTHTSATRVNEQRF